MRGGDGLTEIWRQSRYVFSGQAEQECASAPAPASTSIPGWQRTNMATFPTPHPPGPSSCNVCSILLRLNFSPPGATVREGGGPNVPLLKPFSDGGAGGGVRGGRQERGRLALHWEEGQPLKVWIHWMAEGA